MTTRLDYGIFDCDTHCYETRDAFTRYLPKEYHDRAIAPVRAADGKEVILAGHRIATFNSESGLGFDIAYRPGSLKEMLKQMGSGNPDETYEPQPMRPEYLEREPRLKVMARAGRRARVIFPAGMALAAEHYVDDTEALYANLRSFNRWFDETWGFNYQDKLYATALLSLRDLDSVDRRDRGDHRPGRQGRAAADRPRLRPLARATRTSTRSGRDCRRPAARSPSTSCRTGTSTPSRRPGATNPDPAAVAHVGVAVDEHLRRAPDRRHAVGADLRQPLRPLPRPEGAGRRARRQWVPQIVTHMDKSRGMGRNGPWIGGKLTERPSEIFRRHVGVVPYPEDDIPTIVDSLGYDECLLMGSDFPHAEGLAEPADFVKLLDPLDDAAKKRIMRGNADQLIGRS